MTSTVYCLDFDETLANTDRLRADLLGAIRSIGGEDLETTYAEAYEATRREHGVPRIPLAIKIMAEQPGVSPSAHRQLADMFHDYPYQDYLYPGAEQTVKRLKEQGQVVLLSDGDAFFQSQKIYATSVGRLADGVIILPSKVDYFADLSGYWPAEQYVFIDDKQKVLDAAKEYFGSQAITVLVKQGRYADQTAVSSADISVNSISEVADAIPRQ